MATAKKAPTEQKNTAPVDVDKKFLDDGGLILKVNYSLQTGRPVVVFQGKWTTRDFKNILRAIPRAYRQNQVSLRKQLDALQNQGA